MLIKSSVRFSKVDKKAEPEIRKLFIGNHDIAWSEEVDKHIPLDGKKQKVQLPEVPYLRTFSTINFNQRHREKLIRQEYLSLGKTACDLAQQCFPDLIDRPIDGIKLLIASANAYDAWTDKQQNFVVEGSLATGKAFLHAYDVLAPFFPVLQQYKSHKQVAGLLLKMADSVYVVQKEYNTQSGT